VELTNSRGSVHGGASAILLELAGALAMDDVLGDETTEPLHFSVRYLRAVPAGNEIRVSAEVRQSSRSFVSLVHELTTPDGRLAVWAESIRLRRSAL
jgi:uncharacterized protein (TIGR00369 family)